MRSKINKILDQIYHFLPVRLLILHFKKNHILLFSWFFLFVIVTGNFGRYLGIPFLFLDPEYLNEVNFRSFFIIGISLGGLTVAFHIASYIIDGIRFTFLGMMKKPFTRFSLNNSIIPLTFLIIYIVSIVRYQLDNEFSTHLDIAVNISGLLIGFTAMTFILYVYFWFTNKDIFIYVVCAVDEKLKKTVKVTRASAMKRLDIARKKQVKIESCLGLNLKPEKVIDDRGFYDRGTILQVFDQNHFNLVVIELLIFILILVLGIFKDYPVFQLPAAASAILFMTIFVMFTGAFSYWFGEWSATAALAFLVVLNVLVKQDLFGKRYEAFGLNYDGEKVEYSLSKLESLNSSENIKKDKANVYKTLEAWRSKYDSAEKPKMVFVCVSGGGQRAALWTLTALQRADSITNGSLTRNAILFTGASGGLLGAAYFRELLLQSKLKGDNLYDEQYLHNISNDNLNPIIFSLLVNDFFVGFQHFQYADKSYYKDRGYSFEQQINKNTNGLLDKPLSAYRKYEEENLIPMMIMAPTIINDGRRLYIGANKVSYMNDLTMGNGYTDSKLGGVDFLTLFEDHGANDLRFLSALRMSATFPYITPNITLPSDPPLMIMDAGITDNFGISDAIRFLYAFREWIEQNTSGVVILSIRDSKKNDEVEQRDQMSLIGKFSSPISSIYQNFENLQDITNDNKIEYARSWFDHNIERVDIQYVPDEFEGKRPEATDSLKVASGERASLSWRLTGREKKSIIENINSSHNQQALSKLKELLQ
ncbi:MAG: patatin-like phospholipase family protein [Bacteroidota bacterium]